MKTVKEVALNLEVSQVTVYNHLKKLDKELQGNIFKKKGVTYIDDEGVRQIKISMGLIQVPQVKENISMDQVIENISDLVTERVSNNIKKDYEDLMAQVHQLQQQNRILIDLFQDKQNDTLLKRIKGIFKR